MKNLLFNIYKVCYLQIHKTHPKSKPDFLSAISSSTGVFLFIGIAVFNIYVPYYLLLERQSFKLDKSIMPPTLLLGNFLVYLLLFKALGLKNLNYWEPEHKPSDATVKKTWTIYAINAAILILVLTVKIIVKGG
jgi:hypothetical protein